MRGDVLQKDTKERFGVTEIFYNLIFVWYPDYIGLSKCVQLCIEKEDILLYVNCTSIHVGKK